MKNRRLGKCSRNDVKKKGYKITIIIPLKIIIEENTPYYLQVMKRREIIIFVLYFSLFSAKNMYS